MTHAKDSRPFDAFRVAMADRSRRDFLKAAAAAGAAIGAGAYGAFLLGSEREIDAGTTVRYRGAERVGGPADRALPVIPAHVADDGTIEGRLEHPEWLYYCGMQDQPALHRDGVDETIRYAEPIDDADPWFAGRAGEPVRRDDLVDEAEGTEGFVGATALWRGGEDRGIPVIVCHLGDEAPDDPAFEDGVGVFAAKCTHLCCVSEMNVSPLRSAYDAEDELLCSCHLSRWDPASIAVDGFEPTEPRGGR